MSHKLFLELFYDAVSQCRRNCRGVIIIKGSIWVLQRSMSINSKVSVMGPTYGKKNRVTRKAGHLEGEAKVG